jgi:hypothetical protein
MTEVVCSDGYETLTGRKNAKYSRPVSYLRTSEVAGKLGFTIQEVGVLVRLGILKEKHNHGRLENTRFFTWKDVDAYLTKFGPGGTHTSLEDATDFVNAALSAFEPEDPVYFRRRWVDTAILKAESNGFQIYVGRQDLSFVIEHRRKYAGPREAASFLNISRATLLNWVKTDKLRPASGENESWRYFHRTDLEQLKISQSLLGL